MKVTTAQLAVLVVGTVLVLAIFGGLIALDKDVSTLATLVVTLLGIATGSGITYKKAAEAARTSSSIEEKVNGRMSELISIAAASGEDVSRFADLLPPADRR